MRKFLFALMICLSASLSFSQAPADQITVKNVFGGVQFFQNGKKLTVAKMVKIMEPNEAAYAKIKSAQSNKTVATILGIPGGFLLGWSLGSALAGAEPNWVLTGVGAGLVVASIPFSINFNKQSVAAVDIYNERLKTNTYRENIKASLCFKGNAVGLSLNF
jgi:hypothetical protein